MKLRPVVIEKLPADKFGFGLIGPEDNDEDTVRYRTALLPLFFCSNRHGKRFTALS